MPRIRRCRRAFSRRCSSRSLTACLSSPIAAIPRRRCQSPRRPPGRDGRRGDRRSSRPRASDLCREVERAPAALAQLFDDQPPRLAATGRLAPTLFRAGHEPRPAARSAGAARDTDATSEVSLRHALDDVEGGLNDHLQRSASGARRLRFAMGVFNCPSTKGWAIASLSGAEATANGWRSAAWPWRSTPGTFMAPSTQPGAPSRRQALADRLRPHLSSQHRQRLAAVAIASGKAREPSLLKSSTFSASSESPSAARSNKAT